VNKIIVDSDQSSASLLCSTLALTQPARHELVSSEKIYAMCGNNDYFESGNGRMAEARSRGAA
jgi:hypothetical protein